MEIPDKLNDDPHIPEIVENMWGDTMTRAEFFQLVRIIRKMSIRGIDDYWFHCRFIWQDRGENKALPDWLIQDIKDHERTAKYQVLGLFEESYKKEVMSLIVKS